MVNRMLKQENNTVQALWVGMGSFSSFALSLVSAAILSRYFDKQEYGTYKQILFVYGTLIVIFSAGLPKVFSYFLPRYNLEQGKDIVWKLSKVLALAGLAFSIFLFSFSGVIASLMKNPELSVGLKYFSPIPLLLLPTFGIEGIFSTYKKTHFIAIYNTITRILMLLFIVLPVIVFNGTYLNAIYGWVISSLITLILAYFFKGIPFKGVRAEEASLTLREVFSYSLPLVTAGMAGIAIRSADQFLISRYFGAEIFAEFSNGFVDIPLVGMITGATSLVLMPQFSKIIYEKGEINTLLKIWESALIKSASLIYPMVIFFVFTAKECVILLYSQNYEASAIYFRISMILNLFNIVMIWPLLFSLGETRFYSNLHIIFAFIAWIGGYLVIQVFNSPIALAIFSVTMAILRVIIALRKSAEKLNTTFLMLFPIQRFLKLLLLSGLSMGILSLVIRYLIPQTDSILRLGILGLSFTILVLTISKYIGIDYTWIYKAILHRISHSDR